MTGMDHDGHGPQQPWVTTAMSHDGCRPWRLWAKTPRAEKFTHQFDTSNRAGTAGVHLKWQYYTIQTKQQLTCTQLVIIDKHSLPGFHTILACHVHSRGKLIQSQENLKVHQLANILRCVRFRPSAPLESAPAPTCQPVSVGSVRFGSSRLGSGNERCAGARSANGMHR